MKLLLAIRLPSARLQREQPVCYEDHTNDTTHVIPVGNYVIVDLGNYVIGNRSDLGNYVIADTRQRPAVPHAALWPEIHKIDPDVIICDFVSRRATVP